MLVLRIYSESNNPPSILKSIYPPLFLRLFQLYTCPRKTSTALFCFAKIIPASIFRPFIYPTIFFTPFYSGPSCVLGSSKGAEYMRSMGAMTHQTHESVSCFSLFASPATSGTLKGAEYIRSTGNKKRPPTSREGGPGDGSFTCRRHSD